MESKSTCKHYRFDKAKVMLIHEHSHIPCWESLLYFIRVVLTSWFVLILLFFHTRVTQWTQTHSQTHTSIQRACQIPHIPLHYFCRYASLPCSQKPLLARTDTGGPKGPSRFNLPNTHQWDLIVKCYRSIRSKEILWFFLISLKESSTKSTEACFRHSWVKKI